MTRRRRRLPPPSLALLALALGCGGGGEAPPHAAPAEAPATAPEPETRGALAFPAAIIEAEIADGRAHRYEVPLATGQYLEVLVEQHGVDVVVTLARPDGTEVLAADSPTEGSSYERLAAVGSESGVHSLSIRPLAGKWGSGRYRLRLVALRAAGAEDRLRAEAFLDLARGQALAQAETEGAAPEAVARLERAGERFARLADAHGRGVALFELGVALRRQEGDGTAALAAFAQSLPWLAAAGLTCHEATALHFMGEIHRERNELPAALAAYRSAVAKREEDGDRAGQARALNQLGLVARGLGELQEALDSYDRAIAIWGELGEPFRQARPIHNRGKALLDLGRFQDAREDFVRALAARRREGNLPEVAQALTGLAQVEEAWSRTLPGGSGSQPRAALHRALAGYREALDLHRQAGDALGEGVCLGGIGTVQARLGEVAEALDALGRALQVFERLGDRREQGLALLDLGALLAREGRVPEAMDRYHSAMEHFTAAHDRADQAAALSWMATARWRQGDLAGAAALLDEAVATIEALRAGPRSPGLRASYLATRQNYFELAVDLAMERHRLDPGAGFAARALELHERSRARSLLDSLARGGADGPLAGSLPRAAPPLSSAEIQLLLDREALLLEYHLGPERSFLWAVTGDGLEAFPLPGRREVEEQALAAYVLLSQPPSTEGRRRTGEVLAALSRMLLAPVADRLEARRLLVVPGGALQYLPFAALPAPGPAGSGAGDEEPPLLSAHEIVHLPSASALGPLRRRGRERAPAARLLAVVADPVFDRGDSRFGAAGEIGVRGGHGAAAPGDRYPRLARSREEAEAILGLVPPGAGFEALGFEARKDLLTGGALSRYRIVHLATHGEIDAAGGRLPHLVFSLFDASGDPLDGLLGAEELYGLRLPADLVVLSACRTALGEEVRGEGLVGLTQGFFHAGASRLLVSLWSVDDHATSELMRGFYRRLLAGSPPATALREAQLQAASEPAWRSPYFWAPFVLLGDWRWEVGTPP